MENRYVANTVMIVGVVIVVLAVLAYMGNRRDDRTLGERVESAGESLSEGLTEAGQDLQNRSPAEKAGDAISNTADKIENRLD